jgi:hypothetical protein
MKMRLGALICASVLAMASVTGLAGVAASADKGPVAGAWSCLAHNTGEGDMNYTFNLEQTAEQVTGNFTAESSDGTISHDVKNGSFKNGKLELHFDDDEGTINVTGGLDGQDAMKGDWTQGSEGGTWECKRGAAAAPAKQ